MSEPLLVIGNHNYSSWSLRPWFLLKHFNIDFRIHRIPLFTESTKDEMEDYSPNGKVPVLHIDGRAVWDSLSICEFVSEKYLDGKGWPEELMLRSRARSAVAEMHSGFPHVRNTMPMNCRRQVDDFELSPEAALEVRRIQALWQDCLIVQENPQWLFGDFSIADAFYAPVVWRFNSYGVKGYTEEIDNYMNLVLQHPAMIEWLELSKKESEVIDEAEV